MSENVGSPYSGQQGAIPPGPMPPSGAGAAARVAGPAMGLMITAGVGIVCSILGMLMNMLGMGLAGMRGDGGENALANMMGGGVGLFFGFVGIIVGVVVFIGARKMKALESYGFVMVSTILAMIPCISPCCILGLPIGIWALIVLLDANVKAAFRS